MSENYDLKVRILFEGDAAINNLQSFESQANGTGTRVTSTTIAMGNTISRYAGQAANALLDMAGDSAQVAIDFESATAKIIAASGVTGQEAEQLRARLEETAKTLGVDYGTGATAAMNALESLVKAGLDPSTQAAQALEGALQLAIAGELDTASASDMLVQAMTMFGKEASESADIVDSFVKASNAGIGTAADYAAGLSNVGATAANMGMSMDETLAALVQLDNTFGSALEGGTFLNRMLLDMSAKAEDAGLSLYNADGSMKSLDAIVGQMREKLQGFGDDQAAVNEWLGQFDTRAQKAIVGLTGYDQTLAETESQLGNMAGAQEYVSGVLDTTAGRMAQYQAQQENLNIGIGGTTKSLQEMFASFTAGLGPTGALMNALGPSMLQGTIQTLTTKGIGALIERIGEQGLKGGIMSLIPNLGGGGLGGAFSSLTGLLSGGGGLLSSLGSLMTFIAPAGLIIGGLVAGAVAWNAYAEAVGITEVSLANAEIEMRKVSDALDVYEDTADKATVRVDQLGTAEERLQSTESSLMDTSDLLNKSQDELRQMAEAGTITWWDYYDALDAIEGKTEGVSDALAGNSLTDDLAAVSTAARITEEDFMRISAQLDLLKEGTASLSVDMESLLLQIEQNGIEWGLLDERMGLVKEQQKQLREEFQNGTITAKEYEEQTLLLDNKMDALREQMINVEEQGRILVEREQALTEEMALQEQQGEDLRTKLGEVGDEYLYTRDDMNTYSQDADEKLAYLEEKVEMHRQALERAGDEYGLTGEDAEAYRALLEQQLETAQTELEAHIAKIAETGDEWVQTGEEDVAAYETDVETAFTNLDQPFVDHRTNVSDVGAEWIRVGEEDVNDYLTSVEDDLAEADRTILAHAENINNSLTRAWEDADQAVEEYSDEVRRAPDAPSGGCSRGGSCPGGSGCPNSGSGSCPKKYQSALTDPVFFREPQTIRVDRGEMLGGVKALRERLAAPASQVYHLHFPNVRSVDRDNVNRLAEQIGHHLMFTARAKGQYHVRL